MSEGPSLNELLSGEEPEIVEAVEAEAPVTEAEPVADISRDDAGRFAAKDTGVESTVPPTDKLPQEDYKAIREERAKRQSLEAELEALRQQLATPQEPPPSIWEDEQGWQQNFGQSVVSEAVQQATLFAKRDMSEMMMRQAHPDFEDVKAEFLALAEQNPQLAQEAITDPHPWNKAYQIAKTHRTMRDLSATNVDELRAKIRAEIEAEVRGSIPAAAPGLPPSLSNERNAGPRTGPAWSGPKSLEELLRS